MAIKVGETTLLASDRAGIVAKAQLTVQYMPDLKKLLNKIVDHDIASASLNTRFEDIASFIHNPVNISNAFRNRFYAALLAEQGLDVTGIIPDILLALPLTGQRRTYLTYLRIFLNQYITLALFGSLN